MLYNYGFKFNDLAAEHLILPNLYVFGSINQEFWSALKNNFINSVDIYVDANLFNKLLMARDYSEVEYFAPDVYDFLVEVDGWARKYYNKVRFIYWSEEDNDIDYIHPDWQWRKAA